MNVLMYSYVYLFYPCYAPQLNLVYFFVCHGLFTYRAAPPASSVGEIGFGDAPRRTRFARDQVLGAIACPGFAALLTRKRGRSFIAVDVAVVPAAALARRFCTLDHPRDGEES